MQRLNRYCSLVTRAPLPPLSYLLRLKNPTSSSDTIGRGDSLSLVAPMWSPTPLLPGKFISGLHNLGVQLRSFHRDPAIRDSLRQYGQSCIFKAVAT